MPMRLTSPIPAGAIAVALLGPVRPALAIAQLELTPTVGLFVPARDLMELATTLRMAPADTFVGRWKHRPAAAVGARLTYWLSDRFGVEASVLYTESQIERISVPLPQSIAIESATLLAASSRALVRAGVTPVMSLHLMGGVGLVSRRGPAYTSLEGTTELGLSAGAGLVLRLAPHMAFRLDLEDYMSSPNLRLRSSPTPAQGDVPTIDLGLIEASKKIWFQHYLVIMPAVSIRLGGS